MPEEFSLWLVSGLQPRYTKITEWNNAFGFATCSNPSQKIQ